MGGLGERGYKHDQTQHKTIVMGDMNNSNYLITMALDSPSVNSQF